jgi:hypothetical protein
MLTTSPIRIRDQIQTIRPEFIRLSDRPRYVAAPFSLSAPTGEDVLFCVTMLENGNSQIGCRVVARARAEDLVRPSALERDRFAGSIPAPAFFHR